MVLGCRAAKEMGFEESLSYSQATAQGNVSGMLKLELVDVYWRKTKKHLFLYLHYTTLCFYSSIVHVYVCHFSDFVCKGYSIGFNSAVCIFSSVILAISTYPVSSVQGMHYPHLNWKPNTIPRSLKAGWVLFQLDVLQLSVNRRLLQSGNATGSVPQQTPGTPPLLEKVLIVHWL